MNVHNESIEVRTKGNTDILDLTGPVFEAVRKSRIKNGLLTVAVSGSTAGITTIEFEPGLVKDLKEAFERLAPSRVRYRHDERGEDNGLSHIRSSIAGTCFSVPVKDGRPFLGTWQQVVLVDFDTRPRSRTVLLQVLGEPS